MENRTLIIVVGCLGALAIAAFVAIALFYEGDKGIVFAGLTGLIVLFIPQLLSLKASTDNSAKLSAVNTKLDSNTATTIQANETATRTEIAVDGRITQLMETVEKLAAAQTALVGAEKLAEGIVIGQNTPVVDQNPELGVQTDEQQPATPTIKNR